jgi:hypothetical protein
MPGEPGLQHLFHLFLRERAQGPAWPPSSSSWPSADATAAGAHTMRLFTPAGQARARAFYGREGFTCSRARRGSRAWGCRSWSCAELAAGRP